jgi:hypothetical protein
VAFHAQLSITMEGFYKNLTPFNRALMEEWCRSYGVPQSKTTLLHPMRQQLTKFIIDWVTYLQQ